MSLRRILIGALATPVLYCAGVTGALAETCHEDLIEERPGLIEARATVRAETVTTREALALVDSGSGVLVIERRVDDFWRWKTTTDVEPDDLVVRLRIVGGGDREGDAVHADDSGSRIPVRLLVNRPQVLCEDADYRILSGGFTALGRASGIGLAGFYALEIDVDVEER